MNTQNRSFHEMRKYPRHEVTKSRRFFLDDGYQEFTLINFSRGGLFFLSPHRYEVGRRMRVNFQNLFEMEIEVKHQEVVITDETFMEASYKVGGEFTSGPIEESFYLQMAHTLGLGPDELEPLETAQP